MGCGSWSRSSFADYSVKTKKVSLDSLGVLEYGADVTNQDVFKQTNLSKNLDPKNVVRECRDNEEHPNTVPVILALDCTGSMGQTAVEIAKQLNIIMTELYEQIEDVEFLIMGIGDFYCDRVPLQASQFESDIRIAEQLDELYFEFGGGGNSYESYTAAWYFGLHHCDLDCWKRGKKGIIITIGDECLNPHIPLNSYFKTNHFRDVTGDTPQEDIDTKQLYEEASQKFDIYHIDVNHRSRAIEPLVHNSWKELLDDNHYESVRMDGVTDAITDMIIRSASGVASSMTINSEGISW